MGRGVVEHDVQLTGGELSRDAPQEGKELLVTVARPALADDLAAGDLQGGVEVGGAVST